MPNGTEAEIIAVIAEGTAACQNAINSLCAIIRSRNRTQTAADDEIVGRYLDRAFNCSKKASGLVWANKNATRTTGTFRPAYFRSQAAKKAFEEIETKQIVQAAVLEEAVTLLREGGYVLYSTHLGEHLDEAQTRIAAAKHCALDFLSKNASADELMEKIMASLTSWSYIQQFDFAGSLIIRTLESEPVALAA